MKWSQEAKVGVFSFIGILLFSVIIIQLSSAVLFGKSGFHVTAYFREAEGIEPGNPIHYAGVDVGMVDPMIHVSTNGFGKQEEQLANNLTEKSRQNIENKTDKLDTIQVPVISEISKEEAEKIRRVQDTYGPCLLQQGHPILKRYLLWQKENLENIRGNLMSQRQPTPRQQYRIAELDHELSDIVFCLYKYFS